MLTEVAVRMTPMKMFWSRTLPGCANSPRLKKKASPDPPEQAGHGVRESAAAQLLAQVAGGPVQGGQPQVQADALDGMGGPERLLRVPGLHRPAQQAVTGLLGELEQEAPHAVLVPHPAEHLRIVRPDQGVTFRSRHRRTIPFIRPRAVIL